MEFLQFVGDVTFVRYGEYLSPNEVKMEPGSIIATASNCLHREIPTEQHRCGYTVTICLAT